jgi:hypothetical protein
MEKIEVENKALKIKIQQYEISTKLDFDKIEKLKKEIKELKKICSVYNINV